MSKPLTAAHVLGRAMFEAEHGEDAWKAIPSAAKSVARIKAEKVISKLAALDWICVPLDEIEALEKAAEK